MGQTRTGKRRASGHRQPIGNFRRCGTLDHIAQCRGKASGRKHCRMLVCDAAQPQLSIIQYASR